jgi:nucleotide-binding universal stress UspA family protein
MSIFRKICVGTNFSPEADQGLELAAKLARMFNAEILILHVVEEPLEKVDLSDVSFERRTLKGPVGALIKNTAEELDAELIVMGTHGRSGIVHVLLGSVAEQVTREAECSVLTVRPKEFQFALP